ncbi:MAG: hypothetical protein L0Y72_01795 [Gemmataceae bacterium]|nr:hypothetical protein [Gemmataceae bacterium]MCI0737748.1 hypothetical protein [Gemmataceae bacterium]
MIAEPGDKVRLKLAKLTGTRAVIEAVHDGVLVIRLEESGARMRVDADDVTNLSLAARKAWVSVPDRRVGRPKGLRFCDRVSVTLRIDRDLWEDFQAKETLGLIEDRTALINELLRAKLARLAAKES